MGKLLSIGIACIGLPIFLLYICLVGRFLGRHLQTLYNKVACCARRPHPGPGEGTKERAASPPPLGVPGWLCGAIVVLYLALGTLTMAQVHNVTIIDGLLYTFSLMVTIGVTLNGDTDILSVIVTCIYILVGVAIMSMCAYCLSQVYCLA